MTQVAPAIHEARVWLYYAPTETHPNALVDYDGLDPYWSLSTLLINVVDGGQHEFETTINGERARIAFRYSPSGLRPHPDHDVDGDRLYEFDLNVQLDGERKVDYNISPRFEDMRDTDGEPLTFPFHHTDHDAGVCVDCQPSNVDLEDVPVILSRALHELYQSLDESMYHGYFQRPFGGRISAVERYVRVSRSMNKKLISTGGVLDRLSSHLSDADGTKGVYKWDNERVRGHHHVVRHDSTSAGLLVDNHELGGQIKSYLPEHPEEFEPEDPLYHPKVGAKFVQGRNRRGAVPWSERDRVVRELDERLLSVLAWADIPTEAGGTTYVADDHFTAAPADDPVPLHRDPLPELEERQEDILAQALSNMTDSDEQILGEIADGGSADIHILSQKTDKSLSTIYRSLDRLQGVIESDNGHVVFTSEEIRTRIRAVLEDVEDRLKTGAERVRDLVDLDARQTASSAFDKWLAKYGAEFEAPTDTSDSPTVRIDTILSERATSNRPDPATVIREMLEAWETDGRNPNVLRNALVDVQIDGDRMTWVARTLA